ncbi:MAG TPA: transposase [Solirubrobacteraceae bacterium]|jgi:transposase
MGQRFVSGDRDQALLLPPDVREWLPEDHLALFVIDAVEALDLAAFCARYRRDGWGRPAYDPAVMVAVVLYAYAVGVRSARAIERRCVEDVAFRVVAANLAPDHATIARFRAEHERALGELFSQVLRLCQRAGLVRAGVIAVDSTKIAANASGLANMDFDQLAREVLEDAARIDAAEDALYGDKRGDELPPELVDPATRKRRLRELLGEIKAERDAEAHARQAMLDRRAEHERETGRRPRGRPPVEQPKPTRSRLVNVTDPDSRPVRTPRGFIQGYNAQLVAADGQVIVAADVTTSSFDQGRLGPMVTAARSELAAAGADRPEVVLADAGYWASRQISELQADGLDVLVPPDAHNRTTPSRRHRRDDHDRMRERLDSPDGAALYRRRMIMIEPIFGQTKANRRTDRFQRRGLDAVRSEWRLITATHNLLKLWRAATALSTA